MIINPSRCALFCSDQWGTVSNTYKDEILETSPLKWILERYIKPFGTSNGVEIKEKRAKVVEIDKSGSKEYL